jgi:hypothetical protein
MSVGQLPVVERIAQELLARLRSMIGRTNINTKVREVFRPSRVENRPPIDGQIVVTDNGSVMVPELHCPGNPPAVAKQITFNIRCQILNDEKSCEAIDQLVHTFAADVQNAVVNGDPMWYTFDGNAVNAMFGDEENVVGDGGYEGVSVPIEITYRVSEHDAYEVRS